MQGGRGHWTVNYACTQSFRQKEDIVLKIKIFLIIESSHSLAKKNFLQNLETKYFALQGNFVYHQWGCTLMNFCLCLQETRLDMEK